MLLEGPDLRGLLREIESNYGRDFKVIQAEQVRSGGIGGFFAKQHYEVTIEIVDPRLAAGIAAQPVTAGMSLSEISTRSQNDQAAASAQEWARDLLEQARALNSENFGDISGAGADPVGLDELTDPNASGLGTGNESPIKKQGFRLRLRNKRAAKKRAKRPSRTAPASPEQQSRLRDLLTQSPLIEETPVSDQLSPADRLVAAMDFEEPALPITVPVIVQEELPPPVPVVEVISTPELPEPAVVASGNDEEHWRTQISDEIRAQRNKVERFYSKRGTLGPDEARLLQVFTVAETIARSAPPVRMKTASVPSERPRSNRVVPAPDVEPIQEPVEVVQPPKAVEPKVRATAKPAAFAIKFQAPELADQETAARQGDLSQFDPIQIVLRPATKKLPLSRIPVGVPLDVDDVLVLVGDAQEAYEQACAINELCGRAEISILAIAPAGVSVVGLAPAQHFQYSGADQVLDLVNRQQMPTIVIVHSPFPMGTNDLDRVRIVKAVEALKADHVWAVVDACRTVASLSRWTQCFGNISAVMVVNQLESTNPGALKALGIPIVFRDGLPCEDAAVRDQGPETFPSAEQIGNLAL
jgi:hypothetical protein